MLLASFEKHPLRHHFPPFAGFRVVESQQLLRQRISGRRAFGEPEHPQCPPLPGLGAEN